MKRRWTTVSWSLFTPASWKICSAPIISSLSHSNISVLYPIQFVLSCGPWFEKPSHSRLHISYIFHLDSEQSGTLWIFNVQLNTPPRPYGSLDRTFLKSTAICLLHKIGLGTKKIYIYSHIRYSNCPLPPLYLTSITKTRYLHPIVSICPTIIHTHFMSFPSTKLIYHTSQNYCKFSLALRAGHLLGEAEHPLYSFMIGHLSFS